jgi:hypothetical protein
MIRKCEKENLLLVLPMAYRDALRDKETVYIMLNYRDKAKVRITWGKAPQAGYLILGVVNYTSSVDKATAFLYWPMIDTSYPVYSEYIGKLQATVPCEVW